MKEKRESRILLSNVWYLCAFAWKEEKKYFFWKTGIILLQSAIPFISIIFLRFILDGIIIGKSSRSIILLILAMAGLTFLAKALISILEMPCRILGETVSRKVTQRLGIYASKMLYSDLENPKIKDTLQNAQNSSNIAEIFDISAAFVKECITAVGTIGIVISLQPSLLILAGIVVGLKLFSEKRSLKLWDIWYPSFGAIMRKIFYLNDVIGDAKYSKEIRLNHLQSWLKEKWEQSTKDYIYACKGYNKAIQRNCIPGEIAIIAQEVILYLYLAWEVIMSYITVGDFSMYLQSIKQFSNSLLAIIGNFSQLLQQGQFIAQFRYCAELSKKIEKNQEKEELEDYRIDRKECTIEFENVSFQYPNSSKMTLKNIKIKIKAGESLSIVGQNGAGKTTFVKLLCRFYVPTTGKITLNGIDIQKIPYKRYANLLGVIFQDFQLFAFTVEDNILLNFEKEEARLKKAIEESGVKEKIEKTEYGIQTTVTREFDEKGITFSGGETQKLALARAIYKDAPIMILDEPTSALDPRAEYELYEKFHQIVEKKTTIYISHRLSSTRFTKNIAVFEDGEIIEYGTHKELLELNGAYAKMFQIQAEQYQLNIS